MRPAGLAAAGLARQQDGERLLTRGETLQRGERRGVVVEREHALGAGAQFRRRLRAAQQQQADDRGFVATQVEHVAHAVLELRDARGGIRANEAHAGEFEERCTNVGLG